MISRPGHIERALQTLRAVALTHHSVITCGELLEISHYVARLERSLAERPTWWQSVRESLRRRIGR